MGQPLRTPTPGQGPPRAGRSCPEEPLTGPEWVGNLRESPAGAPGHLQIPVQGGKSSVTPRPRQPWSPVHPGGSFPAPRDQPRVCRAELS